LKKYQRLFSQKILKDIELRDEDVICAKIAHISYNPSKDRSDSVNSYIYDKKLSTENSAIYVN